MPRGLPGQLCEIEQSVLANLQLGEKDTPHTHGVPGSKPTQMSKPADLYFFIDEYGMKICLRSLIYTFQSVCFTLIQCNVFRYVYMS